MKNIESHFVYTKKQRNGIFLLLLIIIGLQITFYFLNRKVGITDQNSPELIAFQKEYDSLKQVKIEESKPKIYPFNPNFITDYKGYTLGMSNEEIDRLLQFRSQDKWINSAKQFQDVTKVSDSLFDAISPYFKFPEWVANPKSKYNNAYATDGKEKTYAQKIDLNKATSSQLQKVYGIGEKLAERIIKYRDKYEGGFLGDAQLQDVYGLTDEVIERILKEFTVKTPRAIQKISLNKATRDQLVTIQYIDYEIAFNIIEDRTLRDGFTSLDELTKVKDFPVKKIEIIKLYLTLD